MLIQEQDQEKFKRLGIDSVSSLALYAPASYEDYRLYTEVKNERSQILDVTIEHISKTPRLLKITAFCHNLEFKVELLFFSPKPYMMGQFSVDERYYIYGKIDFNSGHAQTSHPLKVTKIGSITPKYKTPLRNDVMQRLVKKYILHVNLTAEGLPAEVVDNLMAIHFPNELSGKEFLKKQLYALKFTELYEYMSSLIKKRKYFKPLFTCKNSWKSWSQTLPFKLTPDQIKSIEAIANDLSSNHAARRMVVGDVGSGKTMVILASVIIAQPYRCILMAPTTILAQQLFEEAQKFLPNLHVNLVTNKSKKNQSLQKYDFIIGTHALLYRELPQAALIMVDEQHRFGTAQRNLLEKLVSVGEKRPHFLQFSATPIPRTQAMIDSAQVDVSLITQTPFKKNIETRSISKRDFPALLEHIKSEIELKHQVLIVYPLVEQSDVIEYQSIDEARGFWQERFDDVYVTYGKDKNKEEVLLNFREKGTILLATTVVEVGISLPKLTTVIIVGAERLGLSTLHQLRGRVSRTGLQGYCYLFSYKDESERLSEFSKTTNGFDIAALDLKYRKSGDLLIGKNQSGNQFKWVDIAEDEEVVKDVKRHLLHQGLI
ncbi:MAG: ATP-dependent DNA helicase RecG [Campylobacterota bacterium]|nr:ATP-dependent DNA helicase RecG [Campylobacterota bacterium]